MKQNYQTINSVTHKIIRRSNFICCLIILGGLLGVLNAQQSYTFTPCGATGAVGPTQLQVNSTYTAGNSLNGSVTISGQGIQQFTVPTTGLYKIQTRGAGGFPIGIAGRGASIYGEFNLTAGTVLKIAVGQAGQVNPSLGTLQYGGGGGSFVSLLNNTPLNVAGGGGGSHATGYAASSADGTVSTNGNDGVGSTGGIGGTLGSGGAASSSANGGAGFTGDGGGTTGPALSFTNGALGGNVNSVPYASGGIGGFGGGGGTQSYNNNRGGGGGGYSGGGGAQLGQPTCWGGGGGSYNSGTNQLNLSGANTFSDGVVIITEACNISLTASGTNSLNPSICSGQSLSLTTNGISNYAWSTGNTTNSTIVVSPGSTTVYTLSATSPSNCTAIKSITVIVNTIAPVLSVTNTPNTICLGKTATLTASGAISYTWAGGPGGIINGQTFTPTATSNYTVTGQNGCGTTTSVTTITIAPLAVSASASPSLSCSGNPVTMTVTSAATGYTWSPGPVTGSNVIVAPTANTVYTVTASDGTCSGVTTVTVNTKPNPTITIAASNQTVCQGAVVTMTASGAITYTWMSPSSNAPNISDNPTSATLYQVSGTNSVNCVSSANQLVFTSPTPTLVLTPNKTIVCSGDPVTIMASGATTYNWTNGPATASYTVNPTSGNNTYTASGTTAPCTGTAAITINVLTASVAVSVATPSICIGETASLHASGATTYTWVGASAFSPGNANVTPSVTTIYTVNATTIAQGLSCPSSANITITVFNNPVVTIVASNSVVCKSDPNIVLTGGGATTYTWSTATVSTNISVHPQSTTTYSVTGVDANGCMNTASQVITVNACTGIAELTKGVKSISVYPNPSNGEFVVSSDSEIHLRIINELGQVIQAIKLSEQNEYKVSVTNLANGVYFIVGENSTDKVYQKIVVAK